MPPDASRTSRPRRDSRRPPTAAPPVVVFDRVTKTFDNGFTAIKDVSFVVDDLPDKMEFVTILGPSGCGKSTVLRLIAGLTPHHPATTGTVLVGGNHVGGPGADRGMVFQDYTSFDNRTVEDNIAFGLECRGVGADERRSARARMDRQRWGSTSTATPGSIRISCPAACASASPSRGTLILGPRIILMDEPFGALDPAHAAPHAGHARLAVARGTGHGVLRDALHRGSRVPRRPDATCSRLHPGTILKEMQVPPPDFPAKEMQRQPEFMEIVYEIRDMMESLESSTRAGDE